MATDTEGLTTRAARDRLRRFGANTLPPQPRRSLAGRVLEQVRDPMIVLLVAAALLATFLGDGASTVIIVAVVVFNTTAGVVQQVRAERAIAALHDLVAPQARVRRDGRFEAVPVAEVVPGDVVALTAGDVVPADGVLGDARDLQVDESRMTGESLPVARATGETVTGGTQVTRGRAIATVVRTGADSGIGRIATALTTGLPPRTPLQRRLARLSRLLVTTVAALTAVVVAVGLVQGRSVPEMVIVGLSLAVAAVPESLPAVVAVALALGARRMAARNAVVSSLPAVETLGSVTVVATDKTGTITEGVMVAEEVWTPGGTYAVTSAGYAPDGRIEPVGPAGDPAGLELLLRDVRLCNDAELREQEQGWSVVGDPLEGALLALAAKSPQQDEDPAERWPRVAEQPFDHRTRRMTTVHRDADGTELRVTKGAPEAVLDLVAPGPDAAAATSWAERTAGRGYRVIAVADARTETGRPPSCPRLAGLVAIGDPPRQRAPEVVRALGEAGIRVILVTGDHARTAQAIAHRVGIASDGDWVVEGTGPTGGTGTGRLTVFARVRPEQKLDLVEALQDDGEIVAMLGDGVNDAPALRRADIGVAAGLGGTEVAKQAADLVLMDDDLGTVVAAVEEGRRVFANIRAFLTYAISGGLAEVAVMLLGPVLGLALPLLPGQILWINLLTHGLTGVAFGAEPADPRDMRRPPRPPSEAVLTRQSMLTLGVAALMLTVTSLVAGLAASGPDAALRTAIFACLGLGQLGVALALRARHPGRSLRERGLELALVVAAVLQLAAVQAGPLQALLGTTGLSWGMLGTVVALATLPGLVVRGFLGQR
ncbi:cation-translocating P-type ATPase [Nocardioides humi]|uniref:HAD-IC family P-type ATPase n=1 Tax=Nocardioides humi TaxID=449461 RepID=A0ABN2BJJ9_9ACTN|nr:cation-transporting P-type ATPase [Nocardioides humi]